MTVIPETAPGTQSTAVRERLRALEGTGMRTFAEPEPLVWARTSGTTVWDEDGRPYLDLYAGFAAATVGYCHPTVTAALLEQAQTMTHCPSAAPSKVRADFYERLVDLTPRELERVMLAVTGSAANELAVQLARAATGRRTVVSFSGAYVGRSVGTVGLAGKRAYRSQLAVDSDAQFLPYPDPYRPPRARGRAVPPIPPPLPRGLGRGARSGGGVCLSPRGDGRGPSLRRRRHRLHRRRADTGQRRRRDPARGFPRGPAPRGRSVRCRVDLRRDPVGSRAQRAHVGLRSRGCGARPDDCRQGDRRRAHARSGRRPRRSDDYLEAGRDHLDVPGECAQPRGGRRSARRGARTAVGRALGPPRRRRAGPSARRPGRGARARGAAAA